MSNKKNKDLFRQQQTKDLYAESRLSVVASLLAAAVLYYSNGIAFSGNKEIFGWIFFLCVVAVIRAIDGHFYFKSTKKVNSYPIFFTTFTLGIILMALAWGGLFWNGLSASTGNLEYQVLILLIASAVITLSTVFLSIHLGILFSFQLIILLPLEVKMMMGNTYFSVLSSIVIPIYFFFQILAAKRLCQRYFETIHLQIGFKEKEKQYKDLQYAVNQHGIVSITDVKGTITYANERLSEISQYSQEELIGENHRLIKSSEHSYGFWKGMYKKLAEGSVWHAEVKNLAKDGTSFWVDSTVVPFMDDVGQPYQYVSIRSDITQLKQLEQQSINDKNDALIKAKVSQTLQGQNTLKQRITDSLAVISKIDGLQIQNKLGVFLLPEGACELEMFVTHGEYTEEFLHKEKCVKLGECLCGRVAVSGDLIVSDDCFTDPDHTHSFEGMVRHGHYIVPLNHDGKVQGILFMYTDPYPSRDQARLEILSYIGDLFGLAVANERVKQKLEQAKKNAEDMAQEKSDFLANMSHEIRTPMNGVLGMLDLLNGMDVNDKAKGYIDIAHGSANMLLNVINDILDISKIESGKLHIETIDFDLRKAIEDTSHLLSKLAYQKNIELSCYIPPELKTELQGDFMRLQQVLNNLVSNAIKFTSEGEVSISVSTVNMSKNKTRLRFEIKDTGIGIPDDKQDALFHAFTQADTSTSRKYGGTGLGLAICKNLVEMMGGEIGLDSEVGKGSTFWFELPFLLAREAKGTLFSLKKLRILVIDDNETNCTILTKYIENWGAKVVAETLPESGLYRLLEAYKQKQPFDVLLLDMQMPGVTGQQVAEKIRSETIFSELKIILLSSMGLDQSTNEHKLFDLLLNKPIRQTSLYDAISTVQNRREKVIGKTKVSERGHKRLMGRILFVDDNIVNQQVGIAMLVKLGLDYEVASNGQEALDAFKTKSFDLVLMDCQMPLMDGFESTKAIRLYEDSCKKKRITIIALTANAMQSDRKKCLAAGMDDYLAKPYNFRDLLNVLQPWLKERDSNYEVDAVSVIDDKEIKTELAGQQETDAQADLIEMGKFNETKDVMAENFALIVDAFIDSGHSHLFNLRESSANSDMVGITNTIHTLKGSCGVLGVQRLYEYCVELEEQNQVNEIPDIAGKIEEICTIFDDSVLAIQALMTERESS